MRNYYAAVPVGRITGFFGLYVGLFVCLSCTYGLFTQKYQKNVEKIQIGVVVCFNSQPNQRLSFASTTWRKWDISCANTA